jgi:hypothetical protein
VLGAVIVVVGLVTAGCGGGSGSSANTLDVSKATWHAGEWPFTVASGTLACVEPPADGAVTFAANGTTYAVNGTAADSGYKDIHPIWKRAGGGLRVYIGDMIDKGLALCPH